MTAPDNKPFEWIHVHYLASDGRLLGEERFEGKHPSHVEIPVRDIAHHALNLNAARLIISHNHPSGQPEPGTSDFTETRNLVRLFHALGIHIDDHIIVADQRQFSFRNAGLL